MSGAPSPVDRLRSYLKELAPEARALLISELEREALRGGDSMDIVLRELRQAMRGTASHFPRIGSPSRVFFKPVEPFLVNEVLPTKVRGRIARSFLGAIWTWIGRELAPAETATYTAEAALALATGDEDAVARLVTAFQDLFVARVDEVLHRADNSEDAERKLAAHIGSPRHLAELRDVATVIKGRDALVTLAARLAPTVRNLSDEQLTNAKAVIDSPLTRQANLFDHVIILTMGRLVHPWQIVRFAVKAADTDVAAKVADTPYAIAVNLAFIEMERLVLLLGSMLKSKNLVRIEAALHELHDCIRGVRTEVDLSVDGPWTRRLAAIRKDASALVAAEINPVVGEIRRLVRPRRPKETVELDPADVEGVEKTLELFLVCRTYAGEIALNELATRLASELESMLDSSSSALIEGLRSAAPAERAARLAQIDVAARLSSRLFGPSYAQLLIKAADVASGDSRPKTAERP